MSEVLANGLRFHVQRLRGPAGVRGPVTPVVFLHGLVLDNMSSFYYTLAAPIARTGADVVLYDQRGHGRTDRPATGYDVDTAVADLAAVLEACHIGVPVHLVGNSFGGLIALHAARTRPDLVASLILIEGQCLDTRRPGEPYDGGWVEEMANTLNLAALGLEAHRGSTGPVTGAARKTARLRAGADALLNGTTLIEDVTLVRAPEPDELRGVACPVLALYGELSELVVSARRLAELLPECTLAILPGVAHTVLREATDTVLAALLDWLPRHELETFPPGVDG
ncbi:alpha/beta hydrolase [Streptomyces sp. SID3343]|uniref:alpha/beta fold hydrolase n=1 Tax=Streptomyces sp. SID3343 TaxID=2690260 RepID=UPI0013706512|nr:alpha/beta fold hydrolase [Streptomyces sp. SID3343]